MENIKDYVLRQKKKLKEKIEALQHKPTLGIIQVGHVEASNRYVKNKIKELEQIQISITTKEGRALELLPLLQIKALILLIKVLT